jgi:hypothetical protein
VLEIVQLPDAPQSFALVRRHRCGITTISTWPTRNAAHDALYDELHAIILPRRSRRLERVVTTGGTVAAVLTLAVVALVGGAWLGFPAYDADPGMAIAAALHPTKTPAAYVITLDSN